MPTLADRCRHLFPALIRQRGEHYFEADRIDIPFFDEEEGYALADAFGTETYDVTIEWDEDGSLRMACSCPYAESRYCKHLWATLLTMDEMDLAVDFANRKTIYPTLVPHDPEAWPESIDDPYPEDESDAVEDRELDDLIAQLLGKHRPSGKRHGTPPDDVPPWRLWLAKMNQWTRPGAVKDPAPERPRELFATLDLEDSAEEHPDGLRVILRWREMRRDGRFGKIKLLAVQPDDLERWTESELELLRPLVDLATRAEETRSPWGYHYRSVVRSVILPFSLLPSLLPRLCATGRFGWWSEKEQAFRALLWDGDRPYRPVLEVSPGDASPQAGPGRSPDSESSAGAFRLRCTLERAAREVGERAVGEGADDEDADEGAGDDVGDALELGRGVLLLRSGLLFLIDRIVRFEPTAAFPWMVSLLGEEVTVPAPSIDQALAELLPMPDLPQVRLPESLDWSAEVGTPLPVLSLGDPSPRDGHVAAHLTFRYGDTELSPGDARTQLADADGRRVIRRDPEAESRRLRTLEESRLVPEQGSLHVDGAGTLRLRPDHLVEEIEALLDDGWRVRALGRSVRKSGAFELSVTSGVDWFDLAGTMDFGGQAAPLPSLLSAARSGMNYVLLDDGTLGLLPADWQQRFAGAAGVVDDSLEQGDGSVRFRAHQALVLDALLASQPEVEVDEVFAGVRRRLRSFDALEPRPTPEGFEGTLRGYQELGLAWLELLADLRLGGCLADDMGLGKTIQVLAHLWRRKSEGLADGLPSLLVVPRSLLYNWEAESQRFTPELSVVRYHGPQRKDLRERLGDHDLVVTTYGTLRRDIGTLRQQEFDVAVLDEAQAIKNPASQTAKASRLVQARQRLALTGTPVENHLGELWSIFEFLNPKLLGQLPSLSDHVGKNQLPAEAVATVARALRPLILRRTKDQVLSDLPPKTEQTLHCDLSTKQRRDYDKLRDYYRSNLLAKVQESGMGRSKILVLEALLRLRQAACHPGLLDAERQGEGSAKLEVLVEQVEQVAGEGHKVLVFSQFTKFLAIVKSRFDQRGIPYEYLDGRTRDRQKKVDRFQTDPDCRAFLISLKAGGVGLNLTAAGYVFLLDPWWNPAVESQAIDRAHRIGQENPVFAYRLIARDTIEEKILKLQEEKKALADAVVSRDGRMLKQLTVQDLELLLG